MITFDFKVKQGDLRPIPSGVIFDDLNQPVDLSHATVYFNMRAKGSDGYTIHALAAIAPDQVANKGRVSYQWLLGDTAQPGEFEAEWEVIFGGDVNLQMRAPNDGHQVILITPKVAG